MFPEAVSIDFYRQNAFLFYRSINAIKKLNKFTMIPEYNVVWLRNWTSECSFIDKDNMVIQLARTIL